MNGEALSVPVVEALLQAPSLAIIAVDKQGRVILWSPSASRLFGWTESEVLGRFLPTVPEDERPAVYDQIQSELKGANVVAREARRLRKDGSLVDISFWTTPLRDSKGEVIGVLGLCADITARKQTEQVLGETQLELQRVLASVSDYLWSGEVDPAGRFRYLYYSLVVERITGRPADFYTPGSERWMSTVHPEDRARLAKISEQLLSGQAVSNENEHRIVLPDGTVRWVRANVTVSQLANGYRRLDGVVSDITARKQSEEALRESELELRRVLGAAMDYFWSGDIDPKGDFQYRYYSPAVERITGRPADFYMPGSERWMSTIHPEDRARISEISKQLRSGQLVSHEYAYRIVLPDKTIRWVLARTTVWPSVDGYRRVDGVVSDITARKQSEEALRESEERYRNLAESAADAIFIIDRDDRVQYVNTCAANMMRSTPKELIGRPRMELFPPETSEHQQREIKAVFDSGQSRHLQNRTPLAGGELWLDTQLVPLRSIDGAVRAVMGISRDITELKRTEATLRESEERYRLMVEAIPQLAWRTDPHGGVTECNGRWYQYTGQTPEEACGFGWKKALHPDDVDRAMRNVKEELAGGELCQVEYRLRRASDGAYRWHLSRTLPIKNQQGRIVSWFGSAVDIEDQKRLQEKLEERVQHRTAELAKANKELRKSETKYRTLVEELPAVTYISALDETCTTLFISPQVKALLGFEPADCEGDADFFPRHVHPDDLKRVLTQAGHSRLSGEPFDCVYRMLHRTGEIVWVRDKAVVVRDEAGRPLFLQGVILDVTERQRAERTLRLQSTALESAANGIVITDCDGRIIWANLAFAKLTGYEPSEVVGKNPRFLNSGKHSKSFYRNLWRTVLSRRVWHGEIINKRKDGSLYNEEMTITPVPNAAGEITHFIAIKQDITESKSAEETRRHLAAIVESSGDAIFTGDFNGIITSWNAGAEQLYNYTAEEMLGRSVSILVPRERKAELREMIKKLQGGKHIRHYETVRLRKGGIPVNVSITVSPMKNAAGQVVGISAITRDITERKKLEQAVIEAGSREQRRIGQDLHDGLCQQLTGIGFLWKAINQREQVRALLDPATANDVSQLITKTIGEARDLARVLCPVELESNDFGVALKNLGLSMERLSAVSFVVRCQRPVLLADKTVATHLYRIAQEAISNAVRHGKATRVWIYLTWKKNRLTLRVKDNGSGFSKRRGLEEGIGMRSMRYRAHAIGGSISIESQRGTGTTVVCIYTQPRSQIVGEARRRTAL